MKDYIERTYNYSFEGDERSNHIISGLRKRKISIYISREYLSDLNEDLESLVIFNYDNLFLFYFRVYLYKPTMKLRRTNHLYGIKNFRQTMKNFVNNYIFLLKKS